MTSQHSEHSLSKFDQYIHHVIVDGRYLNDFQQKPYEVAQKLGLTMDAKIETPLRNSNANQLFESFYRKQFEIKRNNIHPYILSADKTAIVWIAVAIAGVIGAGIVITMAIAKSGSSILTNGLEDDIIDESDERDAKL